MKEIVVIGGKEESRLNLLDISWIHKLLKSRWFPIVPQLVLLLVFALLIAGGFGVKTGDTRFAEVLRNTNLANLIVWSYWWPMIIVTAVIFGRIWCMVCPIELVTSLTAKIGLRRKVPNVFRSKWIITIFYAFILLVGVHTFAIHRIPHRMAFYMLMLLGTALVTGLVFEKRAFCSYICPVGNLLGLYACVSMLEWRAKDLSICQTCKAKECVGKNNRYRLIGRSCTSNLFPATISDNSDCLLCTQCLKVCPNDNLRLSIRKPLSDFCHYLELRPAEVGFILLVSGFVVYEILSEWPVSKGILTWIPSHVVNALHITGPVAGFISALVMFVVFPCVFLLAMFALAKICSAASSGTIAKAFALLLLPTMAGAHLIKAILKMTSRIPYWSYAFSDPAGVETANKIPGKTLVLNRFAPNLLNPVISFIAAAILLLALSGTLLVFHKSLLLEKINLRTRFVLFFGSLAYWGVFATTILTWRFSAYII